MFYADITKFERKGVSKMKKIIGLIMVVSFSVLGMAGYAVGDTPTTTSPTYTVTATIAAGTPDAVFKLYKAPSGGDVDFLNEVISGVMAFDKFDVLTVKASTPQWVSADHYAVVAYANGHGSKYYIKSAAQGSFTRSGGSQTLPAGSFACLPLSPSQDMWDLNNDGTPDTPQGALPSGASLAAEFQANTGSLTTATTAYTSDLLGAARIVQVRYLFPPYATGGANPYGTYVHIPGTQATGTYSGVSVKVTITK
jgi:hypothetical protein